MRMVWYFMICPFQNADPSHNKKQTPLFPTFYADADTYTEKQPQIFTMWKIDAPDSAALDTLIICFVLCFVMVLMCSFE